MRAIKILLFFCVCFSVGSCQEILIEKNGVSLSIKRQTTSSSLLLILQQKTTEKLRANIGLGLLNPKVCTGLENCLEFDGSVRLHVTTNVENGFTLQWITENVINELTDCFELDNFNWFGGPERFEQVWPLEKLTLEGFANVAQEDKFGAIVEPYWLNSKGAYIFVDRKVPLFINQNTASTDKKVCFSAKIADPYPKRNKVVLHYTIVAAENAREAHLHAVEYFLGKPKGHPNYRIIERPIWSTWARYKRDINDELLLKFAQEIVDHGYSYGQFEIDDDWEDCYGALTFRKSKFANITNTVKKIKEHDFTVTLWAHPFINLACNKYLNIARTHGFLVENTNGNDLTKWWNSVGNTATYLDFTKSEVREWFTERLKSIQEQHGIDSFKFDAGETSWLPQVPILNGDPETTPNNVVEDYVRTCASFGDLVEVRTGWGTQDLPVFVRMIDKDSTWGINNGLYTLITTLLQMNLNGYTMVLPDMIGGNGYNEKPSAELFVRWLQANTFMPSIQFSFVPWDYDDFKDFNVTEISRKFVNLHQKYAPYIKKQMEKSIEYGYPVNAPIWWIDPTNTEALRMDTEYLLGEHILVAPVIEEGARLRNIYLPTGRWIDGNNGDVYDGPKQIRNYSAAIDVLPYFIRHDCQNIEIDNNGVSFSLKKQANSFELVLKQESTVKLRADIGEGLANNCQRCLDSENCLQIGENIKLNIYADVENGFTLNWATDDLNVVFEDCFDLGRFNWFGGPERFEQEWPIEKLNLTDFANVAQEDQWGAIIEPYWLNSAGAYIFVDRKVPLFINQNTKTSKDKVCFSAKIADPYPKTRQEVILRYTIAANDDAKEGHLHAVKNFLGKPTGHPNYRIIERPIWSTWARYKRDINDDLLLEFAQEIVDNGYSYGQFEIDDDWEDCYGALTFRKSRFSKITQTVQTIKEHNFTVTLWIHPFVNTDCDQYRDLGREKGYFVKNTQGSDLTKWWNSKPNEALYLDFTKEEVRNWFSERLKKIQKDHGIDSFKFDAGESSWSPQVPVLLGEPETTPNNIVVEYVKTCAAFGDLVEVRTGWGTQNLPIFVRMIDKDSTWGTKNGLYTLITTLLQMNLNGYTMVLPDMIGGNGYYGNPSAELFVRWLQANTFMPSIQFSYVPWDYNDFEEFNVLEISRKFVDLHQKYAPYIQKQMQNSVENGHPVNPPIWWADPTDLNALGVDTEYLLGEDIIVAPVIEEGARSRDIYLPKGIWIDGNNGTVYNGPVTFKQYDAPIEVLPYFIRQGSDADLHEEGGGGGGAKMISTSFVMFLIVIITLIDNVI